MKITHKKRTSKNIKTQSKSQISFWEILKRFFVVWFLMFFCSLVITQQESFWLKTSSSPDQVVFVLPGTPDDWWMNQDEIGTHGAAGDWDYLFQDTTTSSQTYIPPQDLSPQTPSSFQWEIYIPPQTQTPSVGKDFFPSDDEDISYEWDSDDISLPYSGSFTTWEIIAWSQGKDGLCITPWGEYVAHLDFVLAYEQRKDVTNLCNVQKRYCVNGKLTGSYTQKSCKEDTLYSYIKPEAISYTQKPANSFVQPNSPSLNWADFDTHGKINGTSDPIDLWWSPSSGKPTDVVSVSQTSPANIKCVTPWGEQVKNGQFVKAYNSSIGLIDLPCEVELRLCVWWQLKWSYTHRTCTFKKMTYRDYLVQNYDINDPTIWDLINTLNTEETETTYNSSSFWRWLDKYF